MLDAVLLDLDNTLYLYDEPAFYEDYFKRIVPYFANLVPPDQFQDRLLRALKALMQSDGRVPNSLCFLDIFCYRMRGRLPAVWQRFISFYETDYDRIPVKGEKPAGLYKVIDRLAQWGLKLAIASNPLFPLIAQKKRLAWTGLEGDRFELVTHLENMSYVKPRAGYYRQVCEALKTAPERCLMVGNDPINDMAARHAGLSTYLTLDARDGHYRWSTLETTLDRGTDSPPPPDFNGQLADLPNAVSRLMHQRSKR